MDYKARVILNSDLDFVQEEGVTLITHLNTVVVLDKFETSLLGFFDGENSCEDISNKLSQIYDGYVQSEFYDFISELVEKGILTEIQTQL